MLFMIVEHFAPGRAADIYRTVRQRGRMLPEGLVVVDSWIAADLSVCYQLMTCADPLLLQEWVARWGDLIQFTIVPVAPSADTAALMARLEPVEDAASA